MTFFDKELPSHKKIVPKMSLSERLESIELKIRQLALKVRQLYRENHNLRESNEQLHAALSQKDSAFKVLHERLEKAELELEQKRKTETVQSAKVSAQIDQYVKEIDRCIEWLANN
jgi:predicted  nucleic acid-binding Zn-ribbon protein